MFFYVSELSLSVQLYYVVCHQLSRSFVHSFINYIYSSVTSMYIQIYVLKFKTWKNLFHTSVMMAMTRFCIKMYSIFLVCIKCLMMTCYNVHMILPSPCHIIPTPSTTILYVTGFSMCTYIIYTVSTLYI